MRRTNRATMALLLALGACGAPAGVARAPASGSSSSVASHVPSAPEPAADPLAALRARGSLHGDPIQLPARGKIPERWLAFLGDADTAVSAWYVTPSDAKTPLTPVDRWPAGVKVVGGVAHDDAPYLVLETTSVLDQPAGLRAVWADGEAGAALEGVRDIDELRSRLASLPPRVAKASASVASAEDERPVVRALKDAARSDLSLARALAPEGAAVEVVWQKIFRREVERVDASNFASSPRARNLLEIVHGAAENEACRDDTCATDTPAGSASVVMALRAGSYLVTGFRIDAPPPQPVLGPPRPVQGTSDAPVTSDVLRLHARTTRALLGEAPLHAGSPGDGTIGAAVTDLECDGPAVVVREAGVSRVFPLSSMCMIGATLAEPRFEARFADVDGDGRTDAVVRVTGRSNQGANVETSFAEVYLAPPPTVESDEAGPDHGTELALLGAASVDDAVRAALSVATRGTTRADACKVLAGTSQVGAFRRAATADVRVLFFAEPGMPTYNARVVPERLLEPDDVRASGLDCGELTCSATRPFCSSTDGQTFYWFAWLAGKMRLAGAAFEVGED